MPLSICVLDMCVYMYTYIYIYTYIFVYIALWRKVIRMARHHKKENGN